MVQKHEVAQL